MIDYSQRSLDEQHAAFLRTKFLAMPIAGTIAWIGIGIAGAVLPLQGAMWAIYIGTGMIFYLGILVSKVTGEDLLGKKSKGNFFDRLFLSTVAMAVLVYAIAIPFAMVQPRSLPMSVGILAGLMWLPFSVMIGHWVGYFHAISRTVLIVLAWFLFPAQRFVLIPAIIVAIYVVTIAVLVRRARSMGLLIVLALWPSEAVGMQERPWEVAIYAGGIGGAGAIDGSGQLPPPGPVLVDSFQARPIPTFPSWYFGAGAAYLNAGFARQSLRIDPLDRVLTTASATREGGGTIGVRLSRQLAGRARIEAAAEHARGAAVLTREARDQLEATRASFVTLFSGLSSQFVMFSPSSSVEVRESGSVTAITGAVAIDLSSRGRIVPFALVGGGLASRAGDAPSIALTGRYVAQFVAQFGQVFPIGIAQTDTVEIRYALPTHRPVAIVGGGVRYALSRRLTARLDARASLTPDRVTITVDANPTTMSTLATGSAGLTIFSSSPPFSLDFSSTPTGINSLRGPALNDVVTFSARGLQTRFSVTAGLGWKF
jgi:hypothetical protein